MLKFVYVCAGTLPTGHSCTCPRILPLTSPTSPPSTCSLAPQVLGDLPDFDRDNPPNTSPCPQPHTLCLPLFHSHSSTIAYPLIPRETHEYGGGWPSSTWYTQTRSLPNSPFTHLFIYGYLLEAAGTPVLRPYTSPLWCSLGDCLRKCGCQIM